MKANDSYKNIIDMTSQLCRTGYFSALNKTGDISPPEMCPLHHVLTLASVLAEEGSKEPLIIDCWDKGLSEALKVSGFKVFP